MDKVDLFRGDTSEHLGEGWVTERDGTRIVHLELNFAQSRYLFTQEKFAELLATLQK